MGALGPVLGALASEVLFRWQLATVNTPVYYYWKFAGAVVICSIVAFGVLASLLAATPFPGRHPRVLAAATLVAALALTQARGVWAPFLPLAPEALRPPGLHLREARLNPTAEQWEGRDVLLRACVTPPVETQAVVLLRGPVVDVGHVRRDGMWVMACTQHMTQEGYDVWDAVMQPAAWHASVDAQLAELTRVAAGRPVTALVPAHALPTSTYPSNVQVRPI